MTETGEQLEEQAENKPKRNEKGQLLPGYTANPAGRPKGKTLKEFAREFLMSMSNDEKVAFLNSLSRDIVWRMAEGNPHQSTDSEVNILFPIPIDDVRPHERLQADTKP